MLIRFNRKEPPFLFLAREQSHKARHPDRARNIYTHHDRWFDWSTNQSAGWLSVSACGEHAEPAKTAVFDLSFWKNEHGDPQFFSHICNSHETQDRYWKISQFLGWIRTGLSYLKQQRWNLGHFSPIFTSLVILFQNCSKTFHFWSFRQRKKKAVPRIFFKNRQNLPDTFLLEMRKKKMGSPCSFLLYEQNCFLPSLTQLPNVPNKTITNNPVQFKAVASKKILGTIFSAATVWCSEPLDLLETHTKACKKLQF